MTDYNHDYYYNYLIIISITIKKRTIHYGFTILQLVKFYYTLVIIIRAYKFFRRKPSETATICTTK